MLILSSRSATLARVLAGAGLLAIIAAPREARASCAAPETICPFDGGFDAAFIATVVESDASTHPVLVTLHVETMKGFSPHLAEGDEIVARVSAPMTKGRRILAAIDLDDCGIGCTGGEPGETLSIQGFVDQDGMIPSGPGDEVRLSESAALDLLIDSRCQSKLDDLLDEAGAGFECNDVAFCTVGGVPGAPGAPDATSVAIAMAIGALALARRRRDRRKDT
jgi:hypothetical protein